MKLLIALVAGVIGYFVAQLVFNELVSALMGVLIALAVMYGGDGVRRLR